MLLSDEKSNSLSNVLALPNELQFHLFGYLDLRSLSVLCFVSNTSQQFLHLPLLTLQVCFPGIYDKMKSFGQLNKSVTCKEEIYNSEIEFLNQLILILKNVEEKRKTVVSKFCQHYIKLVNSILTSLTKENACFKNMIELFENLHSLSTLIGRHLGIAHCMSKLGNSKFESIQKNICSKKSILYVSTKSGQLEELRSHIIGAAFSICDSIIITQTEIIAKNPPIHYMIALEQKPCSVKKITIELPTHYTKYVFKNFHFLLTAMRFNSSLEKLQIIISDQTMHKRKKPLTKHIDDSRCLEKVIQYLHLNWKGVPPNLEISAFITESSLNNKTSIKLPSDNTPDIQTDKLVIMPANKACKNIFSKITHLSLLTPASGSKRDNYLCEFIFKIVGQIGKLDSLCELSVYDVDSVSLCNYIAISKSLKKLSIQFDHSSKGMRMQNIENFKNALSKNSSIKCICLDTRYGLFNNPMDVTTGFNFFACSAACRNLRQLILEIPFGRMMGLFNPNSTISFFQKLKNHQLEKLSIVQIMEDKNESCNLEFTVDLMNILINYSNKDSQKMEAIEFHIFTVPLLQQICKVLKDKVGLFSASELEMQKQGKTFIFKFCLETSITCEFIIAFVWTGSLQQLCTSKEIETAMISIQSVCGIEHSDLLQMLNALFYASHVNIRKDVLQQLKIKKKNS